MNQINWIKVRVLQKRLEAQDIVSLMLQSLNGTALPEFKAGAHIGIKIDGKIIRQYSLCGFCENGTAYEVAVLKDKCSRGGSKKIHEVLQVGDVVEITDPQNHFSLNYEADEYLLFAGGIGITPILSMAEELEFKKKQYKVHYSARSYDKAAYIERLNLLPPDRVNFYFDEEKAVINLNDALSSPREGCHVYACGPKGFIEAVLNTAEANGWRKNQLHREFFSANDLDMSKNKKFIVKLAKSGRTIEIVEDKSIAETLEEAGLFVPTSCCEGICGMCLIDVLEGEPDHRDSLMTEEEKAKNNKIAACVSRAKSNELIIDL